MKKIIVILLCCVMSFAAVSCNINNSTTYSTDTSSQQENPSDESESSHLKPEPYSDLTKKASIWRDDKGELYIYIKEWDVYRHIPELSSYNSRYFNDNCIVVDGETATISVIHQYGKADKPIIITYHFNKNHENVESYPVELNIIASSEYDTFFVNMHDVNHGYYFLTPSMDGEQDWRINEALGWEGSKLSDWPLFMFETTDGGKSWNQISTNILDPKSSDYFNIFEFISPHIGIISFRDLGQCEVWERTYITVDGGLTWTQMSELPHGDNIEWYQEIIDLEYLEDHDYYRLSVKACNYTPFQVQLWSKDLINWSLIED